MKKKMSAEHKKQLKALLKKYHNAGELLIAEEEIDRLKMEYDRPIVLEKNEEIAGFVPNPKGGIVLFIANTKASGLETRGYWPVANIDPILDELMSAHLMFYKLVFKRLLKKVKTKRRTTDGTI